MEAKKQVKLEKAHWDRSYWCRTCVSFIPMSAGKGFSSKRDLQSYSMILFESYCVSRIESVVNCEGWEKISWVVTKSDETVPSTESIRLFDAKKQFPNVSYCLKRTHKTSFYEVYNLIEIKCKIHRSSVLQRREGFLGCRENWASASR